jgi:hypothetical protein
LGRSLVLSHEPERVALGPELANFLWKSAKEASRTLGILP